MIEYISGPVAELTPTYAVIDCHGNAVFFCQIFYLLFVVYVVYYYILITVVVE